MITRRQRRNKGREKCEIKGVKKRKKELTKKGRGRRRNGRKRR